MDNTFLSYVCDILADTDKGLTGKKIVECCNKFALVYNFKIPVDDPRMLQMNHKPQIPNKRTALKMNLENLNYNNKLK